MQKHSSYKIPAAGTAREKLRQKGQFWTPEWIAEAMVEYVLSDKGGALFDPAVGAGAFLRAAKVIASEKGLPVTLSGMDIDPGALALALEQGLTANDLANITIGDFVFQPPQQEQAAIVANPPYIRHHRLTVETKTALKRLSLQTIGKSLDGRAGLHVYFLIRALTLLEDQGCLAFILPADVCEGKFAPDLWRWISTHYALDAVIAFTPAASPFPEVDTNPLIFFIRNSPPTEQFLWATCEEAQTETLKMWVRSGFTAIPAHGLTVTARFLSEGLRTGLSRPPNMRGKSQYILGDFAQIVRGVATGANDFFFLTAEQVKQTGIPDVYFTRAIGRTRDALTDEITQATLDCLESKGRPTFLLALKGEPFESYPESLQSYLKKGECLGLPQRPLISQRKPWYKTELRCTPPFLFAYLGRRNSRFIRNTAGVIPLTSFLCVYPHNKDADSIEHLWKILSHPDTIANLSIIGKSYGGGAIKVEPRSLEKLPIPESLVDLPPAQGQMRLFESQPAYKS
ncbi:MAG TPA: N-6 DNA methylase [Anaerolineae bacterium]|nr:N-6 DNA methylase [Anaerolineae bacterium]HQI84580.1 N-6 DNA methylase [Anaerolineae bacterium]